jgi:hypothetical protein
MNLIRVGVDLAKQVFQVQGVDRHERTAWRRRLRREDWIDVLRERIEPCGETGMEACGGAHHWAREFQKLGYKVKLFDSVESVVVTFTDTGEVLAVETKERSVNHFFPRFPVGDDAIQLRLDWSCLDENGQPTLDADFIDRQTGKHRSLRGKRKDAHHTVASLENGRRYEWEFDGFSRRMSVAITWRVSVSESLSLKSEFSAEVIPAADRKSKAD